VRRPNAGTRQVNFSLFLQNPTILQMIAMQFLNVIILLLLAAVSSTLVTQIDVPN
jgi:hypothetical protein